MFRPLLALLTALALSLAGCGAAPAPAPAPLPPESTPASASAPAPPSSQPAPPEPEPPEPLGIGEAVFADPGELTPGQQSAVLALMTRWFDSLACLELRDPADLFDPAAGAQLAGNRAVWRYVIGIRRMQRTDLSLLSWQAELTCQEAQQREDGCIALRVAENSIQRFAATPDTDSEQRNILHQFTLAPGEGEDVWTISAHSQLDSLYWTVMGRLAWSGTSRPSGSSGAAGSASSASSGASAGAELERRVDDLLAQAAADTAARLTQGEAGDAAASGGGYDREAAVAYARRWVGERSSQWPDYSRNGGNCQNFVSQCLLAGGIPMDIRSPGIWKWYGSTPDNLPRASGRSAAWSSVRDFLDYAAVNTGGGLSATVDAPYYSGRPGDIIHLGTPDRWRHTVLISQVVTDAAGETVDYLICSNTADLRDFPVSAYAYTRQLLIRVEN